MDCLPSSRARFDAHGLSWLRVSCGQSWPFLDEIDRVIFPFWHTPWLSARVQTAFHFFVNVGLPMMACSVTQTHLDGRPDL